MRCKLIACEILCREFADAIAQSPHRIDVEFLGKGLHDRAGASMRDELQFHIDAVPGGEYDAILLGYALCGNGLHGLAARTTPVVVPRAHDCITLLLGSRKRYEEEFTNNPGTYFRSTGWLERGQGLEPLVSLQTGAGTTLNGLIAQYGEDNGRYLYQELNRYQHSYSRLAYIHTGLAPDVEFAAKAREEAVARGWEFAEITGSLRIFHQLLAGDWPDADFIVVPPCARLVASYDEQILHIEQEKSES
jgi:hypothetical protein